MAELKPLSAVAEADKPKASFMAKASGKPKPRSMKFTKLSDPAGRWYKILLYSHSGAGKTFAIVGFLLAGLKVVVITTDFGGNGLSTVYNELKRIGRLDLADNLYCADCETYEDVEAFCKDPASVFPDIYDLDIDMLVWEGFTGYQQLHLTDKVMSIQAQGDKVSEGREEGLWQERQDWGMIRSGTLRMLGRFLNLHNAKTGKRWHKYVTALENKPAVDKLTNELQKAPMVQGSAGSLMLPAFDLVIEAEVEAKSTDSRTYWYNCVGHGKLAAKSRGFSIPPRTPANMEQLWRLIGEEEKT